ncbi:hypothetical protein HKM20_13230 [Pelagibacterium halotolerans]|nr:hypothetical protein HKM20_13230 [Pelagibacterium halotolerans]
MNEVIREEARLIVLRELFKQPNRSATSTAIRLTLRNGFMISRERSWVEQEFAWLEQMGAVRVTSVASIKIATLTERGIEHLAHHAFIPGILVSSEPVT